MKYNKGFSFWNEDHKECNCGSYAFNLDEWYHPGCFHGDDDEDYIVDNLEYWSDEGCMGDELADKLADFYLGSYYVHLLEIYLFLFAILKIYE